MPTVYNIENLEDLMAVVDEVATDFEAMATDNTVIWAREREFVRQLFQKQEELPQDKQRLLGMAVANPESLRRAVLLIAGIGVTLDPASKFAYLVPRDGGINLDISYMGLLEIAIRSGSIRWGQARVVYEGEKFSEGAIDQAPIHSRNAFAKNSERGVPVGAFVCVKTADGDYLTNPMNTEEINAIRDKSPGKNQAPWRDHWGEMAKKTCVKNAYKYWPRTDRLDKAIHFLNTEGGQGIDLAGEADGVPTDLVQQWCGKFTAAASSEAVQLLWKQFTTLEDFKQPSDGRQKVKDTMLTRLDALKGASAPPPGPPPAPPPLAPRPSTSSPAGKASAHTLQSVSDKFNKAKSIATLKSAHQFVQFVADDGDRMALEELFLERQAALEPKS